MKSPTVNNYTVARTIIANYIFWPQKLKKPQKKRRRVAQPQFWFFLPFKNVLPYTLRTRYMRLLIVFMVVAEDRNTFYWLLKWCYLYDVVQVATIRWQQIIFAVRPHSISLNVEIGKANNVTNEVTDKLLIKSDVSRQITYILFKRNYAKLSPVDKKQSGTYKRNALYWWLLPLKYSNLQV